MKSPSGPRTWAKKGASILIGLGILALLYWRIDLTRVVRTFTECRLWWLIGALSLLIPTIFLVAYRLRILVPSEGVSIAEATRLTLAAGVLNMVLPSRMGDLAKSYFMTRRGHLRGSLALSLVIFERACDLVALLLWCAVGLLLHADSSRIYGVLTAGVTVLAAFCLLLIGWRGFAQGFFSLLRRICPRKFHPSLERMSQAWGEMHQFFWAEKARVAWVGLISILLWFMHLLQIWLLILALRGQVPLMTSMGLTSLAVLAGLLPLTFAGIGTRDAALILLYHPFIGEATAAGVGVLCTVRYLLAALAGLPFLGRYLGPLKDDGDPVA